MAGLLIASHHIGQRDAPGGRLLIASRHVWQRDAPDGRPLITSRHMGQRDAPGGRPLIASRYVGQRDALWPAASITLAAACGGGGRYAGRLGEGCTYIGVSVRGRHPIYVYWVWMRARG